MEDSELLDFSLQGNLEKVKELCPFADVNCNVNGRTPAIHAAYGGHTEALKHLVLSGADVNYQMVTGASPLHFACQKGHTETVRYLVEEAKARTDLEDLNGATAFLATAFSGKTEILRILAQAGANINAQDNGGFTALVRASEAGFFETVKFLCDSGAQLGIQGWNGNHELHLAAAKGKTDIVKLLVSTSKDPNYSQTLNHYGYSPAQLAVLSLVGSNAILLPDVLVALGMPANPIPELPKHLSSREFAEEAHHQLGAIGLDKVLVISTAHVLEANGLPSYESCQKKKWHRSVSTLETNSKILYVSHQWETIDAPDPHKKQYNILSKYLKTDGRDIGYVWLDYSCVTSDLASNFHREQQQNISTAIWCASRLLMLPSVTTEEVPHSNSKSKQQTVDITNLVDYVSQAWCVFEVLAALLTAKEVVCTFQLGDALKNMKIDRPEGGTTSLGFFQPFLNVSRELKREGNVLWTQCGHHFLNAHWQVEEPFEILKLVMEICRDTTKYRGLHSHVVAFTLTQALIEHGEPELKSLWNKIGECSRPDDKLVICNLILLVGIFSMQIKVDAIAPKPMTSENTLKQEKDANHTAIADTTQTVEHGKQQKANEKDAGQIGKSELVNGGADAKDAKQISTSEQTPEEKGQTLDVQEQKHTPEISPKATEDSNPTNSAEAKKAGCACAVM